MITMMIAAVTVIKDSQKGVSGVFSLLGGGGEKDSARSVDPVRNKVIRTILVF